MSHDQNNAMNINPTTRFNKLGITTAALLTQLVALCVGGVAPCFI
jgi:hypothetical protein